MTDSFDRASLVAQFSGDQLGDVHKHVIRSSKLDLDYTAWVHDETDHNAQCYMMTIPDLGCDHSVFPRFVSQPQMRAMRKRIVWVHVDLPGQEDDARVLQIEKYPSLDEVASELILILDRLDIARVVLFGEGAGANLACRFALEYPARVHGLVLVHPTGTTTGFIDMIRNKINQRKLINNGMNADAAAYLIENRFGRNEVDAHLFDENIREFTDSLYHKRTAKNLALFMDAFHHRTSLVDRLDQLGIDCLVAAGKKNKALQTTEKFYAKLCESRDDPQKMINSPMLIADNVGDILGEAPDVLAKSIQFFLQGIGLLSAVPMRAELVGLGRLSRDMSMEYADKPRRSIASLSGPLASSLPNYAS